MPVVVRAFEQDAAGEYVPELEVNIHRRDGIREQLAMDQVKGMFHKFDIKKARPEDRGGLWFSFSVKSRNYKAVTDRCSDLCHHQAVLLNNVFMLDVLTPPSCGLRV